MFSPIKPLQFSLALVFIWFGALKLFGVSPVVGVISGAYPAIAENKTLFYALAAFEIAVGIGILIPRFAQISAWVMIAHLVLATFGVIFSPQAFIGEFPFLSLVGEFVVKNFVLMAGAAAVAMLKAKEHRQ